ncbi:MAG: response regulator [Candidatus Levyibacteriota bacterium]
MNKKILVVDDDEGILEAIEALLESEGYEVTLNANGEILENLRVPYLPDVILLDVLLSGKDGRELCRVLKKQETTKHIPIIMISAHPSADDSVKAIGADAFLAKPFERTELLTLIGKYIGEK